MTRDIPWRRPVASLNYVLSSIVWRQDHNGFSHQDPGFIDHVVNKKSDVIRVYLPPDANTLLSVGDHCLRSPPYVNLTLAAQPPSPSASPSAAHAGTMAMPWQGAALPVSDTAGPEQFTDTRSTGFSHDPQGAAFAAVHISTHIDPLTGPDVFTPTIEEQVVGAPDLMETTEQAYRKAARDMGLSPGASADCAAGGGLVVELEDWSALASESPPILAE